MRCWSDRGGLKLKSPWLNKRLSHCAFESLCVKKVWAALSRPLVRELKTLKALALVLHDSVNKGNALTALFYAKVTAMPAKVKLPK